MNDLEREKKRGLSFRYILRVPFIRALIGRRYRTPGFGLAAQLFSTVAKHVLQRLGPDEGEKLIRAAVEEFGRERGRRIAETVRARGKPLSLRNWLVYTDISPANFKARPSFPEGDLKACVGACTFINGARAWGLVDYARLYCKYVDYAILAGYNPDVTLVLRDRHETGTDECVFRYIMKEENKK